MGQFWDLQLFLELGVKLFLFLSLGMFVCGAVFILKLGCYCYKKGKWKLGDKNK